MNPPQSSVLSRFAKAVAAAVAGGLTTSIAVVSDGHISLSDGLYIALSVVTSSGLVAVATNAPSPAQQDEAAAQQQALGDAKAEAVSAQLEAAEAKAALAARDALTEQVGLHETDISGLHEWANETHDLLTRMAEGTAKFAPVPPVATLPMGQPEPMADPEPARGYGASSLVKQGG